MIDGQNPFGQPIRNNLITYLKNFNRSRQCLYNWLFDYFKNYYKRIAIDLSKQQAFDADPKAIQQINFSGSVEQEATIFFIIEEAKETVSDFSQGTIKVF